MSHRICRALALVATALLVALGSFGVASRVLVASPLPSGTASGSSYPGCTVAPTLTPAIPGDMSTPLSQANANCFAWQEFIALNWPADPTTCAEDPSATPAEFGQPNDTDPVVWETYKRPEEVFLPGGAPPAPWCAGAESPSPSPGAAPPAKELSQVTKFAGNLPLDLSDFAEASPHGAWLTAQSGLLTLYEIRLNKDEFTYITQNKLYDAAVQPTVAATPGINLPPGSSGGPTGSIELKAAWIELDDPTVWSSYKTSTAVVTYPGQSPKAVTVGLVGLHIIHKTVNAPQFVWATFEHVDNAPSIGASPSPGATYTYNNPTCNPSTDHYKCVPNAAPSPGVDPMDAPIQVVRENPIDSGGGNDVAGLNAAMWTLIRAANPESVFLNYELVNTLWPNSPTTIAPGSMVPLTQGDPQPPQTTEVVANTTLETYVQDALTCLDCHASAPISSQRAKELTILRPPGAAVGTPSPSPSAPYAADYSFLLARAHASTSRPPPGERPPGSDGLVALGVGAGVVLTTAAVALARRRRRSAA